MQVVHAGGDFAPKISPRMLGPDFFLRGILEWWFRLRVLLMKFRGGADGI